MLCLAVFLLARGSIFAATDKQTRTFPLPPGRSISLEITVGDVRISGSARADARVEIVRRAPAEDGLARIPIEIDETGLDLRIRVLQADGNTDPEYRTDVTLHLPSEARLALVKVTEGRLALAGLHGAINADVRRGSISGSDLSGTIRLESGIGNVIVDRAALTDGGLLRLRTFNGDAKLSLIRRPADARVLALALNGTIASDIPLTMKETWGPRWGEATLGRGEPVISIDVITGRIEIKAP